MVHITEGVECTPTHFPHYSVRQYTDIYNTINGYLTPRGWALGIS
jgi:hypothetical protein